MEDRFDVNMNTNAVLSYFRTSGILLRWGLTVAVGVCGDVGDGMPCFVRAGGSDPHGVVFFVFVFCSAHLRTCRFRVTMAHPSVGVKPLRAFLCKMFRRQSGRGAVKNTKSFYFSARWVSATIMTGLYVRT